MGMMVDDVLKETRVRLRAVNPQSPDDVRHADRCFVAFSDDMRVRVDGLRKFLMENMYRHENVRRTRVEVSAIVKDLYDAFMDDYTSLPAEWQDRVRAQGGDKPKNKTERARVVADYIAGMTDRYAMKERERLKAPSVLRVL